MTHLEECRSALSQVGFVIPTGEVCGVNRAEMMQALARERFDLLIIGGGITGAGVAREASLRGLKVGLVERGDFAVGTSSRSTKLIHGGLRYLANFDFKLVRESVQERMRLIDMAPHLVKVRQFVFPVYKNDPDGLWKLRAGLTLYDWFAGSGNPVPHKILKPAALREVEPAVGEQNLVGGAYYLDCATDDARMTLEVLQSAVQNGATVANYTVVTDFRKDGSGRLTGVRVQDALTGDSFEVQADRVLAAAGPWADIIRHLDDPAAPTLLRCTKGVHLTLSQESLPLRHPVVMRGRDGRMMFAVPSGGFSYVGTTDTDHQGDPAAPTINRADVTYILDAVRHAFPAYAVGEEDVIGAWSGLRPLIRPADSRNPSAVSRDYALYTSASGLVTVAGGKLTAFRAMASHIIDDLFPATVGGKEALARSTARLPGATGEAASPNDIAALAAETRAPQSYVTELAERFGTAFRHVAAELDAPGVPTDPEGRWLHAQMRHAVQREMAMRLEDILARRTTALLFSRGNGRAHVESLAAAMGDMLGWSPARTADESKAGYALIDAMFAWRKEV